MAKIGYMHARYRGHDLVKLYENELAKTRDLSNQLADLIGYETPAWDDFWRTVPDDAALFQIREMIQQKIKEIKNG